MSETNETRSGSPLRSVVQPQQDGGGPLIPDVQPAAGPVDPLIQRFLRDRDEALLSLDEKKIKAYLRKYGETPPSNPIVFWMGVHKAITAAKSLPIEFRRKSALWLVLRGSKPMDDGELEINAASNRK